METAVPNQHAITGREGLGDLMEPVQVLAQFYRVCNGRDLREMTENWDESWQPVMHNPLGGSKGGWEEIRAVYGRIFHGSSKVYVEFHD
jgi:hypothetical protein